MVFTASRLNKQNCYFLIRLKPPVWLRTTRAFLIVCNSSMQNTTKAPIPIGTGFCWPLSRVARSRFSRIISLKCNINFTKTYIMLYFKIVMWNFLPNLQVVEVGQYLIEVKGYTHIRNITCPRVRANWLASKTTFNNFLINQNIWYQAQTYRSSARCSHLTLALIFCEDLMATNDFEVQYNF